MPSEIIYSVFVSSTYEDLREERAAVQKALLQLHCMPIGMELFGSADEETWDFIRRQIADCDYYVVVIADRYGSTAADGLSYTEKEYDYAREIKKPVLAFVHGDRKSIRRDKTEDDAEKRSKLEAFIQKVRRSPVSFFTAAHDLATQVTVSFVNLRDRCPAVGFIRADRRPLEPALLTVQDVYIERNDDPSIVYKRKLRIVLRNESRKDVIVKPANWDTSTGDITVQPLRGHPWRLEGPRGRENGSWGPERGFVEAVDVAPGRALQTWIGLLASADEVEVRRRHEIRRLGTLIIPLQIDGRKAEQRIRL
jgi:hypothetical protein